MMEKFDLVSDFKPQGDQPQAIEKLIRGVKSGKHFQTLLGVTGSGKTFTIASCIARVKKPTLVISHNKTLAAQLFSEFRSFFPHSAVEYFISYYDYYQPEAYIPQTDLYIEKDASINDEIDRLRLSATSSLLARRDVIIVASVSCIYGLGSPEDYTQSLLTLEEGSKLKREEIIERLAGIYYQRNDIDWQRGRFRIRGDVVEIFPAYKKTAIKIRLSEDEIERLEEIDPVSNKVISRLEKVVICPAKHFVTTQDKIEKAVNSVGLELEEQLAKFRSQNKLLEAQRLETRTRYDMEMLKELGYCSGIENYSRHLSGREPGSRPYCLLDYFPEDFLAVIDESHVTIPQLRGMYEGDRSRKETLVEYGFRLPSALDNRPLKFDEFKHEVGQIVFASATPAEYELRESKGVVEQIIRPTGLVDPLIVVRPTENQIDDLMEEIRKRAKRKERTLVTTLTKRMAEDLSSYLNDMGLKVKYLHSDIDAIGRVKILRDLRLRSFDCLVGVNLLREGLDLPEVSLVAVLDADKEGFLRSQTSLIQVAGRAARNINGLVLMYADTITGSMKKAIEETERRRKLQLEFNKKHGITPRSVAKAIREDIASYDEAKRIINEVSGLTEEEHEINQVISELEYEMELAARNLHFERAIILRDQILELKKKA